MEFLNSTISINPQISHAIPFLTWKSRKNPSRLTIPNSRKLPLHPSFSLYLFRSVPSRKFQISAHFGRPTNRQNYLRKKLTQQQQQQVSHLQNPVHEFDEVDIYESEFDSSGERSKILEKRSSLDIESKFDSSSEDSKNVEWSSLDNTFTDSDGVKESETELRKKKIGESIMWNKLESWVEQYKKDSEFWGIGSGPIFTIFQDSEGKVDRVVVNEDEVLRRSRVEPRLDNETEDLAEVNFKISFAKDLAREMENGSNVIPKNSSVAKFLLSGGQSRLMEAIRGVTMKPGLFSRMSRVGVLVLCGLSVVWAIRGLFTVGEDNKEYTRLEKEMLRRKIEARTEKEKMVKGSVEVMHDPIEPKSMPFNRPHLDKDVLVNSIIMANGELGIVEYTGNQNKEFKDKIEEIRAMARHAREIERRDSLLDDGDGENYETLKESSSHNASPENDLPIQKEVYDRDSDQTTESMSFTDPKEYIGQSTDEASDEKSETQFYNIPNVTESLRPEVSNMKLVPKSSDLNEANRRSDGPGSQSGPHENSLRKKIRIIKSAKEAREYLSRKHQVKQKHEVRNDEQTNIGIPVPSANVASGNTSQIVDLTTEVYDSPHLSGVHDFSHPSEDFSIGSETAEGNVDSLNDLKKSRISPGQEVSVSNKDAGISVFEIPGKKETDIRSSQNCNCKNDTSSFLGGMPDSTSAGADCGGPIQTEVSIPLKKHNSEDTEKNETLIGLQVPETTNDNEVKDRTAELAPSVNKENWIEKNFHEFEPIVKKIGVGFRDNYLVAREKASQELDPTTEMMQLKSDGAENELEWMKDERLREIVFKVRDNELSGRDPFHLMDEEDKCTFFSGLEKKVEQENEKLLNLHKYFHSNIENLDYGADGISLYDPLEKIIPRWKVPPAEKNPEFLNNFVEQRKALVAESLKNSFLSKKTGKDIVHKSEEPSSHENGPVAADVSTPSTELQKDNLASSKTIIESSDGSVRAGKRSGREYWQHTKKWSQGFLESYNAETEPEVKSVMRDIGKDLDRWITEKEIQEAADLMDKLPEKGQKFIKQKLDKVKREMELFGAQAVVSKYREYAEEKEEDYLWWLDLPFLLCIELYTVENGEQRVGFYSLEMAADLELDPKQYHVIAFEDAGDCKNLCYIIQAHMEMLGNGNAFVVARPPKDAFREAKANGFSVTVIRKGQLQLNVDQTLEEVEESIVEMGSKIYHDKITKERSVDINALMKGVFGVSKPAKRKRKRSKRKLQRRIKP
ncbi:hypothetical protein Pfo_001071 [Paulownia fortunei]|nr:hypothetical protein Pfo_001071 [Paulownia fortunei]